MEPIIQAERAFLRLSVLVFAFKGQRPVEALSEEPFGEACEPLQGIAHPVETGRLYEREPTAEAFDKLGQLLELSGLLVEHQTADGTLHRIRVRRHARRNRRKPSRLFM